MSGIDKNTILMLHMNDNTFKDEQGHEVINNGVALETINKKFGNGSAYANNKILSIDSSDIAFNTNDFTIDFWMYYISGYAGCSSTYIGGGNGIAINPDWISIGNSTSSNRIVPSGNFVNNKWAHYALVRHLNTFYYFVNGKLIGSAVINANITNSKFCINDRYGTGYSPGVAYYDEFRISNIARWTEDFIPPTHEYTKYKYLIKQSSQYYTLQENGNIQLLGIPIDNTELEQWFNDYGIDDINQLCTKYNTEMIVSNSEVLGTGKLFIFDIPNNMKNINNVN